MFSRLWCTLFHRAYHEDGAYLHPKGPQDGLLYWRYGNYKFNCWDKTCLHCGRHWCAYGELGYTPAVEQSKIMLERVLKEHEKAR